MLPQGYTRVEYIESTGTQWLNTNVVGKTGVSATIDFEFTSISAEAINILGSKKENIRIYMPHYNSGFYIGYGDAVKLNKTAAVGERHQMTISLLAGQQSVYLDGQQIYTGANTTTYNSTLHMYLFGLNSDEAPAYLASIKLYACQIYDDDTLVCDYIPCRNPDGEAGLYDMVGGRFYDNDGTGEFVCGRALALPEHYKRLSYIESTGTQYIDTRVKPNQDTRVVCKVNVMSVPSRNAWIFGARNANATARFEVIWISSASEYRLYYGSGNFAITGIPATGEMEIDAGKNGAIINGVATYPTTATFSGENTLYLASCNGGTASAETSYLQIYSCQIYDNDVLIRDYIPCQTDTGEVGLYDMETATFYGNAGTGEFVAGGVISGEDVPDVPEALEYTLAGDIVALTWSASSGAETYRVYRDGALIVETEATGYTDTVAESPVAHVYAVTAVNEYGESALSEFVHADIWGDTAPELIYDRTQADVNDAKALISKYMRGEVLDGYEQEMWERGLRGCYNTSDVNRVEYHTRELQNILNANGYNIQIDTQLWAKPDIMRYSDIVRYLGNINAILDAFGRSANAPKLPGIDRWIDYIAANDIEKILYVTRELVYGALAMFRRAGTFAAGNDYVTQVIRGA